MSIALATCEKFPQFYGGEQLILAELERAGLAWQAPFWTDPTVDWASYDVVVIRTIWDYFERYTEFRAWLEKLKSAGARVLNPVATIEMNCDKLYLRALEERGVATVPTCWIAPGTAPAEVARQLEALDWHEIVIKPSVSGGAFRTERLTLTELRARPNPLADILADSHAMVQPFLPEIAEAGEWSFLFFGGQFSHSVVKRPKAGDFRVQMNHGGTYEAETASAEIQRQAQAALDACRHLPGGDAPRLYARVDGVVQGDRFVVVEIELIEPYLFLDQDEKAPARFVAALVEELGR